MCEPVGNSTDPPSMLPAWTQSTRRREADRVERANGRAVKRGQTPTLTLDEWLAILHFYELRCFFCDGAAESLEHVEPLWAGGNTVAENCVPACKQCNNVRNSAAWAVHHFNRMVGLLYGGIANDLLAALSAEAKEVVLGI